MKAILLALLLMLLPAVPADAQVGRLVREGVEAAAKKAVSRTAKEATQEAAEQVLKRAASKVVREAGQESVEAAAKKAGTAILRHSDDVVRATGLHGAAIAAPLVNSFGDDGAQALLKLSPASARRMAILSEDFAAAGRGADWMKLIADKGDVAADWIWKNKGALTVAATATAFLANPDPFLQAGETVVATGIETAGQHVARPLIEETVSTLAPQVAKEIARPAVAMAEASARSLLVLLVMLGMLCGAGFLFYARFVRPWRRRVTGG